MKTIGLIEGMHWKSSHDYREIIHNEVNQRLGGHSSGEIVGWSVDFERIRQMQKAGDWQGAANDLADKAQRLQKAGADCVAICTNTMHKVADEVQTAVDIPLISIIDVVAERLREHGHNKAGLLGTTFTMEGDFYRDVMQAYGIDIVIPKPEERQVIEHAIFEGVCKDQLTQAEIQTYNESIQYMAGIGAQAVIYGCTEIRQIMENQEPALPVFDSTRIHAEALVDFALND